MLTRARKFPLIRVTAKDKKVLDRVRREMNAASYGEVIRRMIVEYERQRKTA